MTATEFCDRRGAVWIRMLELGGDGRLQGHDTFQPGRPGQQASPRMGTPQLDSVCRQAAGRWVEKSFFHQALLSPSFYFFIYLFRIGGPVSRV
jgi:hypothetical protein